MIICAAGDIHGALDRMYVEILDFEAVLGVRFDWVLHVGDLGVWPDPKRIDKATRRHDGPGDFGAWIAEKRSAPRSTLFIKGNHEDFDWLDNHPTTEVLAGLHYLPNGRLHELIAGDERLRVAGIGGCYGPRNFDRRSSSLQGYAKRNYTRDEIETLCKQRDLDIILLHDAPAGVRLENEQSAKGYVSEAVGLEKVLARTRPRVCFFGHHHVRVDAEVEGIRCLGLSKGPDIGSLIAIELHAGERNWKVLGEWPERSSRDDR